MFEAKRPRQTPVILIFAAFTLMAAYAYGQTDVKMIRQGNDNFKDKKYQEAEINYRKALEAKPGSEKANYNLAGSLYKQQKFDEASNIYQSLAGNETNQKKLANNYHNLGNSLVKAKKYQEAADAYKKSLKLNPKDDETRYNLAYAQQMLRMQQQQNQQNKDNKDSKDNKDQKDKNNQQDQQNQKEQQDKGQDDKQQQPQPSQNQISKEDAERILQALEADEKDLQKELKEQKVQSRQYYIEKNW